MAVVVVIEKSHAAAHGFRAAVCRRKRHCCERSDAGFPGDVGKFRHGGIHPPRARASPQPETATPKWNGRGCVPPKRDQPQQLRKPVCWNPSDATKLFNVLRLVLCTQPRSVTSENGLSGRTTNSFGLCERGFVWHFEIGYIFYQQLEIRQHDN